VTTATTRLDLSPVPPVAPPRRQVGPRPGEVRRRQFSDHRSKLHPAARSGVAPTCKSASHPIFRTSDLVTAAQLADSYPPAPSTARSAPRHSAPSKRPVRRYHRGPDSDAQLNRESDWFATRRLPVRSRPSPLNTKPPSNLRRLSAAVWFRVGLNMQLKKRRVPA
jgi:hypothetical protein